jgi:hypothetical protein
LLNRRELRVRIFCVIGNQATSRHIWHGEMGTVVPVVTVHDLGSFVWKTLRTFFGTVPEKCTDQRRLLHAVGLDLSTLVTKSPNAPLCRNGIRSRETPKKSSRARTILQVHELDIALRSAMLCHKARRRPMAHVSSGSPAAGRLRPVLPLDRVASPSATPGHGKVVPIVLKKSPPDRARPWSKVGCAQAIGLIRPSLSRSI